MMDVIYYDEQAMVECWSNSDNGTIRVVLPSYVTLTVDQAYRFGKALIECAIAAGETNDET